MEALLCASSSSPGGVAVMASKNKLKEAAIAPLPPKRPPKRGILTEITNTKSVVAMKAITDEDVHKKAVSIALLHRVPTPCRRPRSSSAAEAAEAVASDAPIEAMETWVPDGDREKTMDSGLSAHDAVAKCLRAKDPVDEYAVDILQGMLDKENNCIAAKPIVESWMRARLVDWLVEVHDKFGFRRETFFLTVAITDRFLSSASISATQLQLVGVTSMWIAAKFEEMATETKPPSINELIYITAKSYTRTDILNMECTILQELQFDIALPTVAHMLAPMVKESVDMEFTERSHLDSPPGNAVKCPLRDLKNAKGSQPGTGSRCLVGNEAWTADQQRASLAWCLLELAAVAGDSDCGHSPSCVATSAWVLSAKLMGEKPAASLASAILCPESTTRLDSCVLWLRQLFEAMPNTRLQAVKQKYCGLLASLRPKC